MCSVFYWFAKMFTIAAFYSIDVNLDEVIVLMMLVLMFNILSILNFNSWNTEIVHDKFHMDRFNRIYQRLF